MDRWRGRWAGSLVAVVGLFLLWICLTALTIAGGGSTAIGLQILDDLSFVLACFGSCFFVLGLSLRFARKRWREFDSLKNNAYGMYLVHYLLVVWLQYAMLRLGLPAIVNASIVFGGTLLFSWAITAAIRCASRRSPKSSARIDARCQGHHSLL